MKLKLSYIAMAAAALVACDRFEPKEHVFENSAYLNVCATSQIQPTSFSRKEETLTRQMSVVLA